MLFFFLVIDLLFLPCSSFIFSFSLHFPRLCSIPCFELRSLVGVRRRCLTSRFFFPAFCLLLLSESLSVALWLPAGMNRCPARASTMPSVRRHCAAHARHGHLNVTHFWCSLHLPINLSRYLLTVLFTISRARTLCLRTIGHASNDWHDESVPLQRLLIRTRCAHEHDVYVLVGWWYGRAINQFTVAIGRGYVYVS